jgi:hypothetical protein
METVRLFLFGALFGFLLSRVGATDYAAIAGMFRLTDLHLMGVIGVAVMVSGIGFVVMRRAGVTARGGRPLVLEKKPWTTGVIYGGLLFGIGWALTGTCPGTALAQVGEGRLMGLFTIAGMLIGSWAWQRLTAAPSRRGGDVVGATRA